MKIRLNKMIERICLAVALSACVLAGGCDDAAQYQKQINKIMNYDHENRIRLFLPKIMNKDGRYVPNYIEFKYVDVHQIKKVLNEERIEETERFLKDRKILRDADGFQVLFSDEDLKRFKKDKPSLEQLPMESDDAYFRRVLAYIPDKEVLRGVYRFSFLDKEHFNARERYKHDVWNKYLTSPDFAELSSNDLVIWVTYQCTELSLQNDFQYSVNATPNLNLLIRDSKSLPIFFDLGYEDSERLYRKHILLVWKNFNKTPLQKHALTVSGRYLAKDYFNPNTLYPKPVGRYREWLAEEIWWQMNRKVEFYFDEKGLCHFENEQQLFDESKNPPITFQPNIDECEKVPVTKIIKVF